MPIGTVSEGALAERDILKESRGLLREASGQRLPERGVVSSLSRYGNVWDNGEMESFFLTTKTKRKEKKKYRRRQLPREWPVCTQQNLNR